MPPGRQTHPSWQFEWHIPQVPTALLVAFGLLPFMSALGGSHAEHWLGLGPSQASDRHVSEHAIIALMVVIFRLPAASAAAPAGLPRSTGMKAESKEDSTGSENRQAATNRSNTADCISPESIHELSLDSVEGVANKMLFSSILKSPNSFLWGILYY